MPKLLRFSAIRDPNPMVGEQVMASRHLDLGHMTARAILRRDRACFCVCLPAGMAG
jgi:hypothetical protein